MFLKKYIKNGFEFYTATDSPLFYWQNLSHGRRSNLPQKLKMPVFNDFKESSQCFTSTKCFLTFHIKCTYHKLTTWVTHGCEIWPESWKYLKFPYEKKNIRVAMQFFLEICQGHIELFFGKWSWYKYIHFFSAPLKLNFFLRRVSVFFRVTIFAYLLCFGQNISEIRLRLREWPSVFLDEVSKN